MKIERQFAGFSLLAIVLIFSKVPLSSCGSRLIGKQDILTIDSIIINDLYQSHSSQNPLVLNVKNQQDNIYLTKSMLNQSNTDVQYSLIAKDIVKLFRLFNSPDITPLRLANIIRGSDCVINYECAIVIRDFGEERLGEENIFAGMGSKEYIRSIKILVDEKSNNRIAEIEIALKDRYSKNFLVSKLHSLLTTEKFQSVNKLIFGSCDGSCKGGQKRYFLNVKDRSLVLAKNSYNLDINVYVSVTKRVNGLPTSFGKEQLSTINLSVSKLKKKSRKIHIGNIIMPNTLSDKTVFAQYLQLIKQNEEIYKSKPVPEKVAFFKEIASYLCSMIGISKVNVQQKNVPSYTTVGLYDVGTASISLNTKRLVNQDVDEFRKAASIFYHEMRHAEQAFSEVVLLLLNLPRWLTIHWQLLAQA